MGAGRPFDGLLVLLPLPPLPPRLVHVGQVLHRLMPHPRDDGVIAAVVVEIHLPKTIIVIVVAVQSSWGLLVDRWFRRFFCLPAHKLHEGF